MRAEYAQARKRIRELQVTALSLALSRSLTGSPTALSRARAGAQARPRAADGGPSEREPLERAVRESR
jgi:hypothetical protein